jgi:hypothetical protein
MRPMTLLASVVFPSLFLATFQVGCSSDSSSNSPAPTPYDSGTVTVPEAGAGPSSVKIVVVGKGTVSSFTDLAGPDAGPPAVNCTAAGGACTAAQGIVLDANAQEGDPYANPPVGDWVFAGWTTPGGEAGIVIDPTNYLTITSGILGPITATFVPSNPPMPMPAPAPAPSDAGTD